MAFASGSVSGNINLWDALIAFLTTDTDLVTAGQQWEVVWTHASGAPSGVVLKGPGNGGAEEIFVGLERFDTVDTDANYIRIYGMTGIIDSATTIAGHINVSPHVRIWSDAAAMKYWFVANGRRFAVVTNMSTVYQAAYAGLFLPYAPPTSYPYPMFIGGTSNGDSAVTNWRSTSDNHAHFPFSPKITSSGNNRSNAWMIDTAGGWNPVTVESGDVSMMPRYVSTNDSDNVNRWLLSDVYYFSGGMVGYNTIRSRVTQNYGGGFTVEQMTLSRTFPATEMFGVLDGAFFCPGVGNAVENIIQIDGADYLVVQNVFRTGTLHYWALRLE